MQKLRLWGTYGRFHRLMGQAPRMVLTGWGVVALGLALVCFGLCLHFHYYWRPRQPRFGAVGMFISLVLTGVFLSDSSGPCCRRDASNGKCFMPEEIEKILELAERPAPQPPAALPISRSARCCRACAFLALGSVIVLWLTMGVAAFARGISIQKAVTQNVSDFFDIVLIAELYLLPCFSIAVAISAVMGFIGAKRWPGNRKAVVRALILTAVAAVSFLVPLLYFLARAIRFW